MKKIYQVVAGILKQNDCVLCGKRGKGYFENKWEFPGGKIENCETKEETLKREILEETGCRIGDSRFFMTTEVEYEDFIIKLDTFLIDYIGPSPAAAVHQELRWVPIPELAKLDWCDADKLVVDHLISSAQTTTDTKVPSAESPRRSLELLAPAGSLEQALLSVEAGCDAVYGGLANWNARMRASNFTLDAYMKLLEFCHKNSVKFYMTLNTLFKDRELDAVADLFARSDFMHPDAVIAADIGLMKMFSKSFPSLNIHASTQFGAYSPQDLLFLQTLNVKRVILARELTLSEIAKLRSISDIELEVFVYGSQCLCFSGQCLWGGITQECSGNRGRCTAPCRDFYRCGTKIGQFLYPQDIDACRIIDSLTAAGINSIKIEGRFRDSRQTAEIVKRFRYAVDHPSHNRNYSENSPYVGYLSGALPVKSMLHTINPRTKLNSNPKPPFGTHDFIAVRDRNGNMTISNGEPAADAEDCFYLKTVIPALPSIANDSVTAVFTVKAGILSKIEFIDNLGSFYAYEIQSENLSQTTFADAAELLKRNVRFSVGEIISNTPEHAAMQIDITGFLGIIDKMNALCEKRIAKRAAAHCIDIPSDKDFIQVNRHKTIKYLKSAGYHNFIFEIASLQELENVLSEESDRDIIIYKLPFLDFTDSMKKILPVLEGKAIMISRCSQLLYVKQFSFAKIIADYTLNLWNSAALAVIKSYGISMFTAHPELSLDESAVLSKRTELPLSVIYAGKIPVGYTRACFGELNLCSKKCGETSFQADNITKNYKINIACDNAFGYRTLICDSLLAAHSNTCSLQRRYIFSNVEDVIIKDILSGKSRESNICTIYGRSVL